MYLVDKWYWFHDTFINVACFYWQKSEKRV